MQRYYKFFILQIFSQLFLRKIKTFFLDGPYLMLICVRNTLIMKCVHSDNFVIEKFVKNEDFFEVIYYFVWFL